MKAVIKDLSIYLSNSLGFEDLRDLVASVFVLKSFGLNSVIANISIVLSYILFVEGYVYSPAFALVMFNILIATESGSGFYASLTVDKEKFDFGKFLRVFSKIVGQNLLLTLAFNMGNANEFYSWLSSTVWISFCGVNFLKTARNLGRIGWIEGKWIDFLEREFADKHSLFKNEKEDTNKNLDNGEF